jgi:hypothetical protein
MKLRYDPFQIFKSSKTPAGLYARQKWLGEQSTDDWKTDFDATTARLHAGYASDGSWSQSISQTIDHLFGFHLTIREPSTEIDKALDWLLAQTGQRRIPDSIQEKETQTAQMLTHLPFVAGRREGLVLGASLFLASIFGRSHDPQILSLYRMLNKDAVQDQDYWKDMTDFNNILRAFVVHPKYATEQATQLAVDRLATLQTPKGDWGNQAPFYLNINALAHLNLPGVDDQLEGAFHRLVEIQQPDGTWGNDQPEWNTFLVVHSLMNKNIL